MLYENLHIVEFTGLRHLVFFFSLYLLVSVIEWLMNMKQLVELELAGELKEF